MYWVLDMAFHEDESRIREGHAQENWAMLRQLTLNLLRQEKTARVGIKVKRLKVVWDTQYLQRVLEAVNEMRLPYLINSGQSHLNFGTGSTGCVATKPAIKTLLCRFALRSHFKNKMRLP